MARLRRRPVTRARALRRRDRRRSPPSSSSAWPWPSAASSSTARAVVHRGRDPRPGAEGEAPDLQRLLRRPHLLARRPGPGARRRRRPARRLRLQLRLRHGGRGGVRGRVVARRPDAPPLLSRAPRSSSTSRPRPTGWASTPRGARCSRRASGDNQSVLLYANAVGGKDGLIFDGGGFVVPERPPGARGAALRARAGGPRWWISIARAACASRTRPGASMARTFLLANGAVVPVIASRRPRPAIARRLRLPRPRAAAASSCRPAGTPQTRSAGSRARRPPRGAGARRRRLLREDRRLPVARHRALRRTRLDAHAARRLARRAADHRPGRCASTRSTCPAAHSQGPTREAARALADELAVSLQVVPIDEAFDRELEVVDADARRGRRPPS